MIAKFPEYWLFAGLLVSLTLLPASCGFAQDDPFGQPAAPATSAPTRSSVSPDSTPAPAAGDATTRAIVQSNPKSPAELLAAVDLLLDLDREDLAAGYVQQILDVELDDQQLFDLYRGAGADRVIRIGLNAGLGVNGPALSNRILDGAERYATSEARMAELLRQVISEDTWQRSQALGDLRLLGDTGAAALIDMLRDDQYQPYWPRIRQAIRYFGDVALGPLVAAWNSNSAKLRAEALLALGYIPVQEAIHTLLGAAHANPGSVNQVVAARSLDRLLGRIPEPTEAELLLYRAARDHLMGYGGGNDAADVKWWRWDPESRRLMASWMDTRTATRIRGYRRARDLVALNPDRADYQRLYWITRLESAKLAGGPDLPLPATVRDELAGQVTAEFLNGVLAEALDLHRIPAAIAACELLAVTKDHSLLDARPGTPAPLIEALNAGSVQLAHAACQAIYQLDPEHSFAGSSRYIDALVYLSRSTGARFALVGHVDREVGQLLATRLMRSGLDAEAVTSAAELLDQANANPDLQLLVLTDVLGSPGYTELLQTLRLNPQTQRIPVLLLVRPDQLPAAQRLAERYPNVLASPVVVDETLLARQLNNLLTDSVYHDASPPERAAMGQAALDQLATYAEHSQRYAFFDLTRHERALSRLLASPASAAQTCALLGRIGTADAQLNLVNMASNDQLPVALRQAAAASFADAVRSRGLMLSRDAIMNQYERYNASAAESPETRGILGSLLDAIERRSE